MDRWRYTVRSNQLRPLGQVNFWRISIAGRTAPRRSLGELSQRDGVGEADRQAVLLPGDYCWQIRARVPMMPLRQRVYAKSYQATLSLQKRLIVDWRRLILA